MNYLFLIFALIFICIGCSRPAAAPPATHGAFPMIRCTEHSLPEFSLGVDRSPSEQEQVALCGCIWSRLGDHDRKVAARLSARLDGRKDSVVTASSMETFPIRFGKALGSCSVSAR